MTEFNSLIELFKVPEGYRFKSLIGCTYSANDNTLELLKKELNIAYDVDLLTKWEKGESVRIYVQQGGYTGDKAVMPNFISSVTVTDKIHSAHAKVFLVKYVNCSENNGSAIWRIIVASANLTNADELNVYATFEEQENDKFTCEFNAALKSVKELFQKYNTEDICNFFPNEGLEDNSSAENDNPKIMNVDLNTLDEMEKKAKDAQNVMIISPFIELDILEKLIPQNGGKYYIVSRSEELNKVAEKLNEEVKNLNEEANNNKIELKYYVLQAEDDQENKTVYPAALHAKYYAFQNDEGTDIYFGSANATNSAFTGNYETMVYLHEEQPVMDSLIGQFALYSPCPAVKEYQKEKKFEKEVRKMISTFEFTFKKYSIGFSENIEVEMVNGENGKQENDKIIWTRTNQKRHLITLKFTGKDGHEKEVTIMVDGDALAVRDEEIKKQVAENVARLFLGERSSNEKTDMVAEKTSNASKKKTKSKKPRCLHSVICSIRDEKGARNFVDRLNANQSRLQAQDRKMARAAEKILLEIYNLEQPKEKDNE